MDGQKPTFREKIKAYYIKILPSLKGVLLLVLGIGVGFYACSYLSSLGSDNEQDISSVGQSEAKPEDNCNVTGINLHGTIETYIPEHAEGDTYFDYDAVASENVLWSIKNANEDPKIKAIILEVDSIGGSPVAGEEIGNAVKNSEKPIVGYIRQTGDSAAYWAVSGADRIWASKNSDVGSIGVTMSYLNNAENNKKEGYIFEQLSSGKFKDSGNPDVVLTKEEKDLFMRDVNIIYQNFMETVSVNRNIPLAEVKKFSDGSTVLGEKAKELGLIDEIGGINEVEKYLEEKIGEKPEICWE